MITLTYAENALKTVYLSAISERLNTSNIFLSKVEQTSADVWGKEIRKAAPNGTQIVSVLKNLYCSIELSDKAIRGVENHSAFISMLNEEMANNVWGYENNLSNALYGENVDSDCITGLGQIFSETATLYGLNRLENPWLKPYIKENAGEINDLIIFDAIQAVENEGGNIDLIVCSHGVRRAYLKYLLDAGRNVDFIDMSGGYKAISCMGVPLIGDKHVSSGTMYILDSSGFKLHQLCDWRWWEDNNGRIMRQTPGKATYTAMLVKYADLICERPARHGKLSGITE